MLGELIRETVKDYMFLEKIAPKHELLKYFIVDGETFRNNPDEEIGNEFIDKFRGNLPTPEEIYEKKMKISYEEYVSRLSLSLFKNYICSLCGAIQFALMMN